MPQTQTREMVILGVVRSLREERIKQNLSMNVLAQRSGLSQSMVSMLERGLRSPTLDTLLRIAEVLQVDLGKLITQASRSADVPKTSRE